MPNKDKPLRFIASKQAGYDAKSRRWRTSDGTIVRKSQFIKGAKPPEDYSDLGPVQWHLPTPYSDSISEYYKVQREASGFNKILASVLDDKLPKPMPVPSNIRAAMALAEYYTSTEGDVYQHIEAPIESAMTELIIDCPDTGVQKELEELYSPENYNIQHNVWEMWYTAAIYGIAFPLEVPQVNKIVMLPPRYVWVGYYVNYGQVVDTSEDYPSPYSMQPPDGKDAWTEKLVETTVLPMSYNTYGAYVNEQILKTWGLPLDQDLLHPVRAKSASWQRYPLPPISRAFDSISSRFVLREARRATIEGIKNQVWAFHLGSESTPPTPGEMKAFVNMVLASSGDRSNTFVWKDPYKVEQHTPQNVDSLMANETMQIATLDVFRDLGSNVRLTTGNGMMVGREGTGLDIDLSIWLKRLEWPRMEVLNWEREFRKRVARRNGNAKFIEACEGTTVRFSKSLLETSDLIKNELLPLYSIGSMSTQTLLRRSGYNYRAELKNKEEEAKHDDLFQPRSTFSQTTVKPETPEKETQSTSTGRPKQDGTGKGEEDEVEASVPSWDETKKALTSRKSTRLSGNSFLEN